MREEIEWILCPETHRIYGAEEENLTMQIKDAIGEWGEVYSRIRPNEAGKVQVVVDGTLRTLAAKGKNKDVLISTGTFIKVVDVIGSTLIIEELNEEE